MPYSGACGERTCAVKMNSPGNRSNTVERGFASGLSSSRLCSLSTLLTYTGMNPGPLAKSNNSGWNACSSLAEDRGRNDGTLELGVDSNFEAFTCPIKRSFSSLWGLNVIAGKAGCTMPLEIEFRRFFRGLIQLAHLRLGIERSSVFPLPEDLDDDVPLAIRERLRGLIPPAGADDNDFGWSEDAPSQDYGGDSALRLYSVFCALSPEAFVATELGLHVRSHVMKNAARRLGAASLSALRGEGGGRTFNMQKFLDYVHGKLGTDHGAFVEKQFAAVVNDLWNGRWQVQADFSLFSNAPPPGLIQSPDNPEALKILRLSVYGDSVTDIAAKIGRSEQTVKRRVKIVAELFAST